MILENISLPDSAVWCMINININNLNLSQKVQTTQTGDFIPGLVRSQNHFLISVIFSYEKFPKQLRNRKKSDTIKEKK